MSDQKYRGVILEADPLEKGITWPKREVKVFDEVLSEMVDEMNQERLEKIDDERVYEYYFFK